MDSTQIEERAITYLKQYLWDSKIIQPFLSEHDKEPCWDGHLYVYSDKSRRKLDLIGRIPVQVKGLVVRSVTSKKFKYQIDVNDLMAYKNDPTIYVVCQLKEDSKDYKLFYRSLLPETIKNILKGKGRQKKVSVLLHEFPLNIIDFEDRIKVFIGDRKKQQSFVDSRPFTLDDARKMHITNFTFVAPCRDMNVFEVMRYLSSHPSFLYATIDKNLNIEFPISDGPMSFLFQQTVDEDISIDNRVFYRQYSKVVKDGKMIISVGGIMTLTISPTDGGGFRMDYKFESKTESLKERIKEAEFVKNIFDFGYVNIGTLRLDIPLDDEAYKNANSQELQNWLELQKLLDKLNVGKDLNIRKLTIKDSDNINVLVRTILMGQKVELGFKENVIINLPISNIKILVWASLDKDGKWSVGDFFDGHVTMVHELNSGKKIVVPPFAYLQEEDLWKECDNIPFSKMLSYYQDALLKTGKEILKLANYDVLYMLKAYDDVKEQDPLRGGCLLEAAQRLNEWMMHNNDEPSDMIVYKMNQLQMFKRQRSLSSDEKSFLIDMINSDQFNASLKAGACLIAEATKEEFYHWFNKCSDNEKQELQSYPVWYFRNRIN